MAAKNLVFVHGMFMTPLVWEPWVRYFESHGYRCLAPPWPGRGAPIATQRAAHPEPRLGQLTLTDVVEHMSGVIRMLAEKPVVIGHSMGGLVTQLLLQRDLAAAGVAIDSAPPATVSSTKWSFLRSNWPMVSPFARKAAPYAMPFAAFQYAFANTLPAAEQRVVYDRYIVPESRMVPHDARTNAGRVDFARSRGPLLLIAGSEDHIVPASLNRANHAKYRAGAAVANFKEFPGRDHFIIAEQGWEEVAAYIVGWLGRV